MTFSGSSRHLFFDLDGTLTDPAPGICACLTHAVRALGRAAPPAADLRRFIGPPLHHAFAELLASSDRALLDEGVRLYRERFSTVGLYENAVYPAIPSVLAALRADGHILCVVTSKPRVYAERIVDHFGLREFFPRVYGAELTGELSTKAELVAHALANQSAQARRACMIGDRRHDVEGARAHGVAAIGVTWGYGSREELELAGADRVVEQIDQLRPTVWEALAVEG
ncbi:MAG TPA: HAD hydrolase-like protein [Polyangiaceae bacterium]|nr:HAD hydrolase-like protein [Polyangiaceae bacterium]